MIPTLVGVSFVMFMLLKLAPGSVESMKFAATASEGGSGDTGNVEAMVEKFRKKYLLDQPNWKQYLHYVGPFNLGPDGHEMWGGTGKDPWNGLLAMDLGNKFLDPSVRVIDELKERLWVTVPIALLSVILSYLLALPIGIYSGVRQGHPLEVTSTVMLFLLYAIPTFWGGLMLQMIFGKTGLDLLPVLGLHDKNADQMGGFAYFIDLLKHLILPILVYSYGSLAYLSRQMRVGVVDTITQDYIRTARAKGLSEKVVVLKHVLRNSMIPIITLLASILPILIGGSIIVEVVFDIPGMGRYAYEGLTYREMNVVMATTLFSAFMTIVGILLSDIMYAVVDPRIRYE